jgi:hypothetical protein
MLQRCRSQPVIIKSNSFNDFVGYAGNKGIIIRELPFTKYPYDYEVELSNGSTDYFCKEELEII